MTTGNVNVIVRPSLLYKRRKEALGASLLPWMGHGNVRAKYTISWRSDSWISLTYSVGCKRRGRIVLFEHSLSMLDA
ncbi:hypothetical protein ABH945_001198 [Paraburkholderia sp. GAS333]